jgi:hypothetical protein
MGVTVYAHTVSLLTETVKQLLGSLPSAFAHPVLFSITSLKVSFLMTFFKESLAQPRRAFSLS